MMTESRRSAHVYLLLVSLALCFTAALGDTFRSSDGNIVVDWDFFGSPGAQKISLNVTCKVTGWCAVGFGDDSDMPDTDIFWGFVHANGTAFVVDRFSLGYFKPPADTFQDITLVMGVQNSTHTTLNYERLLDTCHPGEDYALTAGQPWLLYSMSQDDPTAPQGNDPDWAFNQHTIQNSVLISFNSPLITPICTAPPPTSPPPSTPPPTSPPSTTSSQTTSGPPPPPSSSSSSGSSSKKKNLSPGVIAAIVIVPILVIAIIVVVIVIIKLKVFKGGSQAARPSWVIDA